MGSFLSAKRQYQVRIIGRTFELSPVHAFFFPGLPVFNHDRNPPLLLSFVLVSFLLYLLYALL